MNHLGLTGRVFALGLWVLPASAQTYTTLVDSGPASNRVDIVVVGDGYTQGELGTEFPAHTQAFLDHMFGGNLDGYFFGRYQSFFNVHLIEKASAESGADIPNQSIFVDTAFNATFNNTIGGDDRLLTINTSLANTAISSALSGTGIDVDMRVATVNTTKYGGSGGLYGVYAGGSSSAPELALHEIGHSFTGLADEYFFTDTYTGSEPTQPNATTDPALGKWDRWLGYNDPDTTVGAINYYQGAKYHSIGLYRPAEGSKMRFLNRSFNAVSREAFLEEIYTHVNPLDAWLDTALTLVNPAELWLDTVDPAVFAVDWYVDNVLVSADGGEAFDPAGLGFGSFDVSAVVRDRVLDFANTGQTLDWYRLADTSPLTQTLDWTVQRSVVIPEPGGLALGALVLLRRRRRRSLARGALV